MKIVSVLLAGGKGKRFGEKKQFIKINNEPLFQYSLNIVNKIDLINEIVLVLPKDDLDRVKIFSFKPVKKVAGGEERQNSVYNALKEIGSADIVVIHDTARPLANESMFLDGIENVKKGFDGSITAIPARDTIKELNGNIIEKTLDRNKLLIVQTPQTFKFDKLVKAHKEAIKDGIIGTDDSYLMERLGYKITYNLGSPLNFKITTKEDINLAKCLLKDKKRKSPF
jgi:2-C-methyl-D-erythritol 4-phosphate cytidylyltransferase